MCPSERSTRKRLLVPRHDEMLMQNVVAAFAGNELPALARQLVKVVKKIAFNWILRKLNLKIVLSKLSFRKCTDYLVGTKYCRDFHQWKKRDVKLTSRFWNFLIHGNRSLIKISGYEAHFNWPAFGSCVVWLSWMLYLPRENAGREVPHRLCLLITRTWQGDQDYPHRQKADKTGTWTASTDSRRVSQGPKNHSLYRPRIHTVGDSPAPFRPFFRPF